MKGDYSKKYGTELTVAMLTIFFFWALECFFVAGIFILKPDLFPISDQDVKLMSWVVVPLLTQIPLFYLLLLYILLRPRKTN